MHKLDKAVITVKELLSEHALSIPAYQRPYKWSEKNLSDLLGDLRAYRDKTAYRLGAVVFHFHTDEGKAYLDIVDGQQRTLTLFLMVKALLSERLPELKREDIKGQLESLKEPVNQFLVRQSFTSDISYSNLHKNFMAAKRFLSRSDFTEADIDFLLNRCQVVTFVLTDISEAFQFFDSQNARGRDLDPHDLLKAFHLREFSEKEAHLKAHSVSHWEQLEAIELAKLFANYLFRIRNWAQAKSAQYFTKAQIELFKGVNLDRVELYPYVESLRIAHHFVDDYNNQYQRKIDHQLMRFPFHLDQMVINGRRFFEMAKHYQQMVSEIIGEERRVNSFQKNRILGSELEEMSSRILHTLNTYTARTRVGDKYIRTMFDCAVIFYLDKFGTQELSQAIEKIFVWAYSCRLQMQVVQLATMDKHVLNNNIFERIKQAVTPSDVLTWPLMMIKVSDHKGTNVEKIKGLFQDMKYYE